MELEIGVIHSDLALVESWFQTDTSTGYLEDAITSSGIGCKEQKLPSCSKDQKVGSFQIQSCSTTAQPLHECYGKKIAYPFEMVKPGGVEGETTLKDINNQILMIPSASKPIPHPVKDSVSHPCILAGGFGISGKAVVSLTRIHTQGRGSITIIRTKD
ncbi:hypothetical protein SESBI_21843 [Sesbania bispinosa]|nr:hypothetical protein SESBI_21843 [Sesbania bispinosa]